jgi:FMN-dependent NADH-azoreductase
MATLLHLDSSPLETSVSRELTREFVRTWQKNHPAGRVIYRDVAANPAKPLDQAWISAAYTPEADRTPEHKAMLALSDQLIAELEQADEFVIGVAMHNFSIPSVLKLWVDQVLRRGRTFVYSESGPQGLLHGKKATILAATGGIYSPGTPAAAINFIDPYLKTILGFMGVNDIRIVTAGGTAQLRTGAVDRASLLAPTLEAVRSAAA